MHIYETVYNIDYNKVTKHRCDTDVTDDVA